MRTVALATAKGGVGKTTISVHLAAGFAREGRRVLLVDLDTQGNATSWLLGADVTGPGVSEAVLGGHIGPEHARAVEGRDGLWVLPSTAAVAHLERQLGQEVGGETLLRAALASAAEGIDVAVIDCPPSLGLSVVSALVAADAVLAPVVPSFLSLAGLAKLETTLERTRSRLNGKAELAGFVLFAADGREGITAEARTMLGTERPGALLTTEIRTSAAAKALPGRKATAFDPGADARGADDYTALVAEVGQRIGLAPAPKRTRAAKGRA